MNLCKGCIHYNLCLEEFGDRIYTMCDNFKSKSKFIELPCSPGDFCIWKDAEWYVNVIEWDGEEFVLWISPAHKQAYGVEVLASEVRFMTEEEVDKMFEKINAERKMLYEKE